MFTSFHLTTKAMEKEKELEAIHLPEFSDWNLIIRINHEKETNEILGRHEISDDGIYRCIALSDGTVAIQSNQNGCLHMEQNNPYCVCGGGGEYHTITHLDIPSEISVKGKKYTVSTIGERGFNGCKILKTITIPSTITTIENAAFYGCEGLVSITIPDTVIDLNDCFSGCINLISVVLPKNLTTVGGFSGCEKLENIKIPNTVTKIADRAFLHCRNLKNLVIPEGVTYIGPWAFGECDSLTTIEIPDNVTLIAHSAFKDCDNLTSVKFPKSLEEIYENVFANCKNLTTVTIPDGMKVMINENIFKNCENLAPIPYPDHVPHFEDKEKRIYIENGIRYKIVSSKTVSFVGITEDTAIKTRKLVIPDTITIPTNKKTYRVEYVADNALKNNTVIHKITIGKNVKQIYKNAFENCTSLKRVIIKSKKINFIARDSFANTHKKIKVKVQKSRVKKYKKLFKYFSGLSKKAKIVKDT